MAEEDNILFVRGTDDTSADDIWDDTALIRAYDKAINLAKEEVSKRIGLEHEIADIKTKKSQSQRQNQRSKSQKKWCIGSPCRAVYSEDGEVYEAVITKMFDNAEMCMVKFIGYNNKEKVQLSSLLESEGLQSQIAQQKEATLAAQNADPMELNNDHKENGFQDDSMDCGTSEANLHRNYYIPESSHNPAFGAMPPAPPLPPQLMARLPENDADALSSMLMSWYISGFHTGYYHGLKQAQKSKDRRNK
ncbi:hypothetical protein QAD02_004879 [Eretmocerus hayati]|uniref:Uncharacterized protein n=1 Tax=Eretmocerus hayati TaxID=131215 RepID=A0ACC2NTS5_9HYME|nr:hypothetical protein QAD02_004879 [Eretmocerus hayati]